MKDTQNSYFTGQVVEFVGQGLRRWMHILGYHIALRAETQLWTQRCNPQDEVAVLQILVSYVSM
jgi:hypothetical protein